MNGDAILMAAAASAGQNGASVIVLEANGIVGGSTIRSGGHMLVFDNKINASMERKIKPLNLTWNMIPASLVSGKIPS